MVCSLVNTIPIKKLIPAWTHIIIFRAAIPHAAKAAGFLADLYEGRQRLAFVGCSQLQQALVLRSKSKLNSFHCRDGAVHYYLPELSLSVFCLLYALLVGFPRN